MLVALPHIFQSLPDVPDTEKLINKECRILNEEQKHFDSRNSVCEILRVRERIAIQGSTTNEVRIISFCGAYGLQAVVRASLEPTLLRRNIMVSGINLAALKYQTFQIGTAVFRGTGNCPPCSRMEENLGAGGYAAMLNHGGITAIVATEGVVAAGDTVAALRVNTDEIKA